MGNDGGSILKRADMVKKKQEVIKVSDEITKKAKYPLFSLTLEPVSVP